MPFIPLDLDQSAWFTIQRATQSPEARRSKMDDPLLGSWALGRSLFALTVEDHSSSSLSNLILCMCFDV